MNVVGGTWINRVVEHFFGRPCFNDVPGLTLSVYEEEGAIVGHPLRLLHVMRHNDDCDVATELFDGSFDHTGGDGVKG